MPPLRFSANLSFMFNEVDLLKRYKLAAEAGFKAVECAFPNGVTMEEIVEAKSKAGVEQVLLNVFVGDVTKGELGFAARPGEETQFRNSIEKTVQYAKALGCPRIHIMAGLVEKITQKEILTYENNLSYVAKIFEKENIIGVIEPINRYSVPNYFMNNYELAIEMVKKINSPCLKLLLDIFHLQQIKGDLTHSIKELLPYAGHIQIAQVPNRNEPNSRGEIYYPYIFDLLKELNYDGWIGLEYKPMTSTEKGLKSWLQEYQISLN